MRFTSPLIVLLASMLLSVPVEGQGVNTMHPPEIGAQKHASPEDLRDRMGDLQFQKDAKDLAEICTSVPGDMEGVKQGLLPKDLVEKLKRVRIGPLDLGPLKPGEFRYLGGDEVAKLKRAAAQKSSKKV